MIRTPSLNSVLLFPPVNNFRRFLIHQTCENFRNKYDLFTFSVGQGPFRRTVICFKSQVLDPYKYYKSAATANFETRYKCSNTSTLKNWRSDNRRIESLNNSNNLNKCDKKMGVEKNIIDTNKIIKQNSGELYRPPALRSQINETIKKNVTVTKEIDSVGSSSGILTNASHLQSPSSQTLSMKTTTSISCSNSPIHRNENVNINNMTTSTQQTTNKTQQLHMPNKQEKQLQRQEAQQQVRRERRPDRAVYIPRARRSQTTPPNTTIPQIQPLPQHHALSTQLHAIPPIPNTNTSKCLSQQLAITSDDKTAALVKQKPLTKADEVSKANISGVNTHENIRISNTITKKKEKLSKENKDLREQRREQRLLRKLTSASTQQIANISENYEKHNILAVSLDAKLNDDEIPEDHSKNQEAFINAQPSNANDVNHLSELNKYFNLSKDFNCDTCEQLKENELLDSNAQNISLLNVIKQDSDESANTEITVLNNFRISQCIYSPILYHTSKTNCNSTANGTISTNIILSNNHNNNNNTMPKPSNKTKSNKTNSILYNTTKMPNLRIDNIQSPTKCDIEEEELQRASKEINRSNRRIIKQTFVSDVLQIPDHIDEEENNEDQSKFEINKATNATAFKTQFDSTTEEEEEEDDWESMYNESGDCLDPKIMQELTASVGKCKIELPKMDYSAYLTKQSILNEGEFPHVLEVSNFPVEFKNQDLLMVFSQYKESGFDIKWVDDTHALAVFSSSRIAAEVLTMGHPFVVLKPLAEATVESRLKAKKCAASLQPYRPRPETCAALARRLVTGALGVRLKTAAAERENEKRVLREAKERKLLAAKQRDEVWES